MMGDMIRIMLSTFAESKEKGSYILFYMLALGLGLAVAWDRYGKNETDDNWMVEEAKKKIQLWPFLYGILSLVLVVINPLVIWLFNRKTMMSGQYYKIWGILLFLFLCAYGIVCFISILREKKQKLIVVLGFVILIGLAGSSYGLMVERPGKQVYAQEEMVAQLILENHPQAMITATESFLEYIGVYKPQLNVVYGKDMYTHPLDMGITDVYPAQVQYLYDLMKHPKEVMGELSRWADICNCDVIVIDYFENAPDKAGKYYKQEVTSDYLIYIR